MRARSGPVAGSLAERDGRFESNDDYAERLDALVSIAAEVFFRGGYDGGSLDVVARQAGLRKASLYYYIDKKSDLLRLIFERVLAISFAEFDELESIDNPRDELSALIRTQALLVARNRALVGVFFDQRSKLEPADAAKVSKHMHRYVDRYIAVVDAAMNAGVLPRSNARMVANTIIGMVAWSYRWFDPEADSADDLVRSCVQLVLRPDGAQSVSATERISPAAVEAPDVRGNADR